MMEFAENVSDVKCSGMTRRDGLRSMVAGAGAALVAGLPLRSSAEADAAGDGKPESEVVKAIKAQCRKYLDAIYHGDGGMMDGLFHDSALVYGNMAGEDWIGDGRGLAAICDSNPPGRESGMTGDIRILGISGYSAAVEVVVRNYNGTGSTDFFVMQMVGDSWQVVGKSFSGA